MLRWPSGYSRWVYVRRSTPPTPPLLQIVGRCLQLIPHLLKSHLLQSVQLYSHSRMIQRLVQTISGYNTLKIFSLARPTIVNCWWPLPSNKPVTWGQDTISWWRFIIWRQLIGHPQEQWWHQAYCSRIGLQDTDGRGRMLPRTRG